MRVSFVHTKGGVGKTTSAMMVATAAANAGRPVEVYDTSRARQDGGLKSLNNATTSFLSPLSR